MADTVEFERRKRKRGRGFTAIDNKLFDDDRLQADEQGVMGYLISRPPGWIVNRHQLGERYGFGREAMQRVIWNLASTGWLGIVRHRHPQTGTVHTRLIINEVPGPEMTLEAVKALPRAIPPKGDTWTSFGVDDESDDLEPLTGNPAGAEPLTGQPLTGEPLTANPAGQVISTESVITESKIPHSPQGGECGVSNQDGEAEEPPALPPSPAFAELVAVWPRENLGTGDRAEKRFRRLAADERRAAIDGAKPYVAGQRAKGRTKTPTSPATSPAAIGSPWQAPPSRVLVARERGRRARHLATCSRSNPAARLPSSCGGGGRAPARRRRSCSPSCVPASPSP